MRLRALLTAGTVTAALMANAPAATGEDQRPCVSKREYYSVNGIDPQVRSNIERRFDVVGRGIRLRHLEGRKAYAIRYIACGYYPTEGGVIIRYRKRDGKAIAAKRPIVRGVDPHGHP